MEAFDKAFGAQLGKIVSKRCQRVSGSGSSQSSGRVGMDFGGREAVLRCEMRKAHESLHESQLPRVIELESRNALAIGQNGGLSELQQLPAIDKGFQDVLLDVVIPIDDGREFVAKNRQVLNRFADAVVGHIVGRGFSPEIRLIPHVLLDESILVMTADHRIGQIQIFDLGLQFAGMITTDLMAKDDGEFVGLADRPVRIQQSLTEPIDGRAAGKDQVVAQFNLREEQSVFDSSLLSFSGSEEWNQWPEPFAAV